MSNDHSPPRNRQTIVWQDLPDPSDPAAPAGARTAVVLDWRAWDHVVKKHVLPGREP